MRLKNNGHYDVTIAMRTIPAGEFKSKCLKIMDAVQRTREASRSPNMGVPVALLVPPKSKLKDPSGCLADVIEICGDIVSPVIPDEDWESSR